MNTEMSRDQVLDLLSAVVAYDNRNPTEAQVHAWAEAAHRGRWTMAEALDALHEHYARTTDYVMPGHITTWIKARRNAPPPVAALPAADPAGRARVNAAIAQVSAALGWDDDEGRATQRRAVRMRSCPYCKATPGAPCTRPTGLREQGRVPIAGWHAARTGEVTE